ncbi:hypothetical protein ACFSCW_00540 [Sphingomonas tabacisoli]|uniref:Uncharacterized protein n=1 Tax=Sphingomonas tabacisoli TaxID=2249466 RepID=A0ABW4HYD0_9SPHN
MRTRNLLGLGAIVLLTACGGGSTAMPLTIVPTPTPTPTPSPTPTPAPTPGPKPTQPTIVSEFSFANDSNGFQAGFADYTPGQEGAVAFVAGPERLPSPLANLSGYAVSAANPSGDVFTYIWKLVTGLAPNTSYQVTFSVHFATNAVPGCPGGPGENVWVKAGAVAAAPAQVTQNGRVTVNFDKGNQGTGGANLTVLGNFAQGTAAGTCAAPLYAERTLSSGSVVPTVVSNANGQAWIVIGLDSGFAGTTKIYYLDGAATFSPSTS